MLAFESGAEPVVVLTKADIGKDLDRALALARSVAPDVSVIAVSARRGKAWTTSPPWPVRGARWPSWGRPAWASRRWSTRWWDGTAQRVGHVRADQKGRHTTTSAELVPLPGGGLLMDTPGLRSLGLWSDGEGLDRAFADISERALKCRFPNCQHRSEPGCAVRDHVDPVRLDAYRRLRAELDALEVELNHRR